MPFDSCGDDGSYTCTWLLRPSVLTCIYSGWPLINTKPCKTSRRKDNNVDITFHRGAPNHHFCRSHPPKCLVATLTRTSSSLVCRWYASVAFPSSLKSHFSHSQWPGASGTGPGSYLNPCSQIQYYDFFQTIELEAEHIWKAPVNMLKLTYLLSKYLPYADVPLLVCA